ncbi:MAG: hypothetical protein JWQ34_3154 [Mucilaginibacter sp.]|uniref:hypothetical protein n=1 Tax=Mucilaginibacter sp. TaxID=1882438 RepID=UPI0026212D1A|nr:hypothetical protein [Mucilaginibacter sp.]MDB5004929.1 hypothetical protein [Mucilaginibacter sp.]
MREIKHVGDIIQQHFPLSQSRGNKRWTVAHQRKKYDQMTTHNEPIEVAYHRIVNVVKSLYMLPGDVYFERDYKEDRSEGLYGMHALLTPHFYWRLDCAFTYNYEITYAFNNCSYESEIRKLMQAYPLDRAAIEKQFAPDFNTFYNSVLAVQEPIHIHSFTR